MPCDLKLCVRKGASSKEQGARRTATKAGRCRVLREHMFSSDNFIRKRPSAAAPGTAGDSYTVEGARSNGAEFEDVDPDTRVLIKQTQEDVLRLYVGHIVAALLCFITGLLINGGRKYVAAKPLHTCRMPMLNLFLVQSLECCDSATTSLLCQAVHDPLSNVVTSSWWSPLVSLVPWVTSVSVLAYEGKLSNAEYRKTALNRLIAYLCLIGYRVGILYLGFHTFEKMVQPSESKDCYYHRSMKDNTCRGNFDANDTLVLIVVQHMMICVCESMVALQKKSFHLAAPTFVVCAMAFVVYVRALLFSVSYFHTRMESVVGMIIAIVCGESILGFLVWLLQFRSTRTNLAFVMNLPEYEYE